MALFGGDNDVTLTIKAKDEASAKINSVMASVGKMAGAFALGNIAAVAFQGTMSKLTGSLGYFTKQALDIDSLKKGLVAVAGSAEGAAQQFERLREVAKMPGLGLKEAIEGSVNLQAAGLSAQMAERSLKAFGNALATVGKGKAELDGVTLALQQIAAKGKVSAEEINQLNERLPQIRQAMKDAFGTSNTEQLQKMGIGAGQFIEKVVKEFEKLPPVGDTFKNTLENMRDSMDMFAQKIGTGILQGFIQAVKEGSKESKLLADIMGNAGNISEFFRVAVYKLTKAAIDAADGLYKIYKFAREYVIPAVVDLTGAFLSFYAVSKTVAAFTGIQTAFTAIASGAGVATTAMMGLGLWIGNIQRMLVAFAASATATFGAVAAVAGGFAVAIRQSMKANIDQQTEISNIQKEGAELNYTLIKNAQARVEDAKKTHNDKVIALAQAQLEKAKGIIEAGDKSVDASLQARVTAAQEALNKDSAAQQAWAKMTGQNYKEATKPALDFTGTVKKSTADTAEAYKKLGEALTKVRQTATDELASITKSHDEAVKSSTDRINNLKKSLIDLSDEYTRTGAQAAASFARSQAADARTMGEEIVKQQQKIADLRKQAGYELDPQKRINLEAQLKTEEAAYSANTEFIKAMQAEVDEAKRRASLTDFERQIEDYKAKRAAADQEYANNRADAAREYAARVSEIKLEMQLEQKKMAEEQEKFAMAQSAITKILADAEALRLVTTKKTADEVVKLVDAQIERYNRLADAIQRASQGKPGQVAPSSVPAVTREFGGIVPGPVGTAVPIIAHGQEVVVPASKVGSMGGGNGSVTININNPTVRNDADLNAMRQMIEDAFRDVSRVHKYNTI